jgi:hypothetical protein
MHSSVRVGHRRRCLTLFAIDRFGDISYRLCLIDGGTEQELDQYVAVLRTCLSVPIAVVVVSRRSALPYTTGAGFLIVFSAL